MTDKEVMQMALVQMGINQYSVAELAPHKAVMAFNSAMEVLRAQLEQPDQEPTCPECKAAVLYECVACSSNNYPPAAQPAVPLTDEQIKQLMPAADGTAEADKKRVEVLPGVMGYEFEEVDAWSMPLVLQIARAIEAAQGIKGEA